MDLQKLCLWGLFKLLLLPTVFAQYETPEILVCEADALRKANAYKAAYRIYQEAYPYFAADSNYYMMAYLKTWASEMAYEGGADLRKGNIDIQESYRIATTHLHTDTLSFFPVTLINMGYYQGIIRNYEEKLAFYHRAKAASKKLFGWEHAHTFTAYNNLGYTYGSRRSWKKCLAYLDTAFIIARKVDDPTEVFTAQNNKAHAYAEMGDLERAIYTQEVAVEAAVQQRDYARALNNLGNLYVEVKDWDVGIKLLKKALAIRQAISPELDENTLSTLLNLVWAYNESGQVEECRGLLREVVAQASQMPSTLGNSTFLKIAFNYLSKIMLESNRLNEAMDWVTKAEAIKPEYGDVAVNASTQLMKSLVMEAMGEPEAGLNAIQASYKALIPGYQPESYTDSPDWRAMEAIAYTLTLFQVQARLLGQLADKRSDPAFRDIALKTLEAADTAVTVSRLSYQGSLSKELMAANAKGLYNALIDMHYEQYQETGALEHQESAFLYMEKNKALSVLENLNGVEAARFHDIPQELVEAERSIREDIAFYQLELKANDAEEIRQFGKTWKAELSRLTMAQDSLFQIISRDFPRYYKTRIDVNMPGLEVIREEVLYPEETLIEYFQADEALYVLIADKKNTHFLRLQAHNLTENIKALHSALRNKGDDVSQASHKVYQQVFGPLEPYLKGDKLVIIPDGPLAYIPFDQFVMAEPDRKRPTYLMEAYQIRRLLSGSTAYQFKGVQREVGIRYGITAMAPYFTGEAGSVHAPEEFGPLPGAQKEIDGLDQLFQGTFLRGAAATEAAFKNWCSKTGILHLATHTDINDQFPNATHLLLKESDGEDGKLNVYEIYGQSISAQLGFLSGCNTGFGKIKAGEGAVSLGHAFAYAGCPNIVMTLWPIKDDIAPDLVRVYYEKLSDGLDKAEALRQAKLFSLNNDDLFAHPYYWSGFVYTGDRTPVQLSAFVLTNYLAFALVGLVSIIILILLVWGFSRRNRASKTVG